MGHYREVPAVGCAESRDAVGRAVRIEGVTRWDFTVSISLVVHEDKGDEVFLPHLTHQRPIRKMKPPFSMSHPDTQYGSAHPIEQDCGTIQNLDCGPAGLKPPRDVLDKPRLVIIGNARPGYPTQKTEKLAAVTYAQ